MTWQKRRKRSKTAGWAANAHCNQARAASHRRAMYKSRARAVIEGQRLGLRRVAGASYAVRVCRGADKGPLTCDATLGMLGSAKRTGPFAWGR